MSEPARKVVDEAALSRAVDEHRRAGRRVVFTNGAFDLLHVGHVRMLDAASALGDVLVVAVNDDASVRAAKGSGRPVTPAAERAEVVAALAMVTHVVVFPDATVDRLLRLLKPDVHAKGRDYDDATLPERETDRALGIRTAFVGDEKAHSSSDIAAQILSKTSSKASSKTSSKIAPSTAAGLAAGADAGTAGGLAAHATPRVVIDRATEVPVVRAQALALVSRIPLLEAEGFLDLDRLSSCDDGVEVNRHATRTVRRMTIAGHTVFLKVSRGAKRTWPRRSGRALDEFRNHVALRAAGFRAPEPWLAVDGRTSAGTRACALVTLDAAGTPLDAYLAARFAAAGGADRAAWADGIGSAVRALHTARFVHPDLLAYHLVVCSPDVRGAADVERGGPAGGASSLAFLDLARLSRSAVRVTPVSAAPGLAALALSLRPSTDARFRLAILRAYLGGSLRGARLWLRAIERRIRRVEGRGSFRRYAKEGT